MKKVALLALVIAAFLLSFSLVVCSTEEDDDGRDDDTDDDDTDDDDTDDDDTDDDDTDDDDTDDDDTDDDDDTGETTISGSVAYTGEYAGSSSGKHVYVFIFDVWPTPPDYPPICGTQASVSAGFPVNYGPFECPAISKGQYYPFSYLDYNGNGSFDNTTEPVDVPGLPVTINPGDDKDIDLHLIDTYCSNPATVSGTISYTGTYSGSSEGKKVYVTIYDQPIGSGPPVYNNYKTVPGGGFPFNYSFNNVCLNGNFYPAAYLDYNGNNQFDLGTEPWDPYDDTVSITFGTTSDVDFTLQDTSK